MNRPVCIQNHMRYVLDCTMPATDWHGESQGIRSRPTTILHSDENPVKLRCECRLRKIELEYIHMCAKELPDRGPGSSVGIATELRAGRFGDRIPVGARFPAPVQTGPGAHPASCTMGTGSFPGVKYDWGILLTTHPLLVPSSWKSRAIPLPTPWATPGR
jgi:hypothetical protein